ncbi:MAG: pitrilysin family protein [Patescibacteria group bacterium]|jgi:predicted Zn-dependent peptidase
MLQRTTLPNGLRVLIHPLKETQAVTVMAFVKVGSRYETRPLSGAAHFLEHLFFKGTKRRPTTLTISKELDGIGAAFNAFTSKDHTAYYIKANRQHVGLALDMLSDMLVHSTFDATELNRERGVIIEEIKMYEDNPMALLEDVLEQGLYGNTPLGWNIAGTAKGITAMDRAAMLAFKDQYYVGKNMWLVLAGNVPKNIQQLVQKTFGQVPARRSGTAAPKQQRFGTERITLRTKDTAQVQLGFSMPGVHYQHPDADALSLLAVMLGGTMSSRLFIEIRERRGLCYSIRASVNPYEDIGHLAVQVGLDKARLEEAVPAILGVLADFQKGDFTAEEFTRAKEYVKGKFILDLEDSENIAGWLGKQVLFAKKVKTATERIADIEKVTAARVRALAKRVLQRKGFRLAVVGPYTSTQSFRKLMAG